MVGILSIFFRRLGEYLYSLKKINFSVIFFMVIVLFLFLALLFFMVGIFLVNPFLLHLIKIHDFLNERLEFQNTSDRYLKNIQIKNYWKWVFVMLIFYHEIL